MARIRVLQGFRCLFGCCRATRLKHGVCVLGLIRNTFSLFFCRGGGGGGSQANRRFSALLQRTVGSLNLLCNEAAGLCLDIESTLSLLRANLAMLFENGTRSRPFFKKPFLKV